MASSCMAAGLVLALACLVVAALECRQGGGRLCTDHEHTHPYLNANLIGDVLLPDSSAILASAPFATRHAVFSLTASLHTVLPYDGMLLAFLSVTAACTNCNKCPDDSLGVLKECKMDNNAEYSFHTVAYVEVTGAFGIDGHVVTVPVDFQFEALNTGHYNLNQAKSRHFGQHGVRVFAWDDGVYLLIEDRSVDAATHVIKHVTTVQRVLPSVAQAVEMQVSQSQLLSEHHRWTPIDQTHNASTGRSDYLFASSIEPHQIVQCSRDGQCAEAAVTSHATFMKQFSDQHDGLTLKVGSNAVRVSEMHYGAILNAEHGTYPDQTMQHFAYMFEAKHPWPIVKVSKRPLPTPACQAGKPALCIWKVTGLTFVDGKLVVSYSQGDADTKVHISTVDEIFADMDDVGTSAENMVVVAQDNYISALVEGPQHVDQGARLQRLVGQHLRRIGSTLAKPENMTVFVCGLCLFLVFI